MMNWIDRRVYFLLGLVTGVLLARLFMPKPRTESENLIESIDLWLAERTLSKKRE